MISISKSTKCDLTITIEFGSVINTDHKKVCIASLLQLFFLIVISNDPTRITACNFIIRDILRHNAACSYDDVVSYRDAGKNYRPTTDPNVVAYNDRFGFRLTKLERSVFFR